MHKRLTIPGLLFCLLALYGPAAQPQDQPKPPKLFEDQSRLEVTLKGPWRQIMRRPDNPTRHEGQLLYTDANGQPQTLDIGITTRGLTRRDKVCDFPPLKLWFDKEKLKGTEFRGQKSLKMVTHCKSSRAYEQYYVKEYLSYRIYNLITPYSFRVRPMMVSYLDSERNSKPLERFGFLIEDVDDVAKRHDLVELEIPEIARTRLDPDETSNYMLFQYMIANLDWSATGGPDPVECCHNSKLIGKDVDAKPVYAIPYDLDSSGLVDTHYAAPPQKLPVGSIRDRYYRGFCFHNDRLPAALQRFQERKKDILDLFNSEPLLTNQGRNYAVNFVRGFYEKLDSPDAIGKWLTDKCRG
jgi:hypothetical protein